MFTTKSTDTTVQELIDVATGFYETYKELKPKVSKPKPPTSDELLEWIKENDTKAFKAYETAKAKAVAALSPATDVIQMAADKEQYTIVKKRLSATLSVIESLADGEVKEEATKALASLSAPAKATSNTDTQAIREWAAQNNIEVAPKGRIAQTVVDQYNARETK